MTEYPRRLIGAGAAGLEASDNGRTLPACCLGDRAGAYNGLEALNLPGAIPC